MDVSLKGNEAGLRYLRYLCFNPCSCGCFAESPGDPGDLPVRDVSILVLVDVSLKVVAGVVNPYPDLVSILVLVDVSLKVVLTCTSTWHLGVSILVLVDVSLKEIIAGKSGWGIASFNPCSCGCFAERAMKGSECRPALLVSILVLVDVSLKGAFRALNSVSVGGFNPCSCGCFAESPAWSTYSTITIGFNPCSCGCFAER